jgi:hypothetical protein
MRRDSCKDVRWSRAEGCIYREAAYSQISLGTITDLETIVLSHSP